MAAETIPTLNTAPEMTDSIESWAMGHVAEPSFNDCSILQELNMLQGGLDAPSSPVDVCITSEPVAGAKRKWNPEHNLPALKRFCGKMEPMFATEPVTPSHRSNQSASQQHAIGMHTTSPLSPPSQSMCSEEDDDTSRGQATSPCSTETSSFQTPSKTQAAKRRALRLAHLKRSRCKKEEGVSGRTSPKMEDEMKSECEAVSVEPLDKKAARAIRNREAAMKSRNVARTKMQNLEKDNNQLATKVKVLSEENEQLASQLKSLLNHTFGAQLAEGHDVKDILAIVAQINGSFTAPPPTSS